MTKKIIVVDDTEPLLHLYKAVLLRHFADQIEILLAANGSEAFKIIEGIKDPEEILCVITDYEMREMNGKDFSAHLRCLWADTPIFLHTNTYADNIVELSKSLEHINITVLSKLDSMDEVIVPWIREKLS